MPILTLDQQKRLGPPPRPLGPKVRRVNDDGYATAVVIEYESRMVQWLIRLSEILAE